MSLGRMPQNLVQCDLGYADGRRRAITEVRPMHAVCCPRHYPTDGGNSTKNTESVSTDATVESRMADEVRWTYTR